MKRIKRKVFLIQFTNLVSTFVSSMVILVLPFYMEALGITVALIGLLTASGELTQAILRIPFGSISDMFGRRSLLIFGLCGCIVARMIYFLSQTTELLFFAIFINNVALSALFPSIMALTADSSTRDAIGKTAGYYYLVYNLGIIMGSFVGGFLTEIFPSYREIFLIIGLLESLTLFFIVIPMKKTASLQPQRRQVGSIS